MIADAIDQGSVASNLRALALLRQGRYEEGFREWEARWEATGLRRPAETDAEILGPAWTGQLISGKRILLHGEQGFGDNIQFLRYVPLVVDLGAHVVLELHPALRSLARCLQPQVEIGDGVPHDRFDFHCSLLDLPSRFDTTLDTVPPPASFSIPKSPQQLMCQIIDSVERTHVGLVWAGNPRHSNDRQRSLPFAQMAELLHCPGATFFSLQVGAAAEQQTASSHLISLTPHLTDFVQTAAAILQLDAVITVDTAVAHLAATLGKPTWILLPHSACWRWLVNRTDSPWYPSVRLFRQSSPGDWSGVLHQVTAALVRFTQLKKNASALHNFFTSV